METRKKLVGALATTLAFLVAAAASAQGPTLGRYNLEWSTLETGQVVDLLTGTRVVDVEVASTSCPPSSATMVRNATGFNDVWCFLADGTIDQSAGTHVGFARVFAPNGSSGFDGFYLEAEHGSRGQSLTHAVGRRTAAASPPPSTNPPPSSGGVSVAMTAPRAGAVASGSAWVTAWCGTCTAATKTYIIVVDNTERARVSSPSKGPVSFTWNSQAVSNGVHTIAVKGVDGSNGTGISAGVSISVKN